MIETNINEIIKLRDRGQLTIPEKVRNLLPWLAVRSLLQLEAKEQKIIISPLFSQSQLKKERKKLSGKEWEKVFSTFKKIRRAGKQIDAVKSVQADRMNH